MQKKCHAVRLYVFIDTLLRMDDRPKEVIINRYKRISDLRYEFTDKHNLPYEDQQWLINNRYCTDDTELNDAIKSANMFMNGYICYVFVISRSDINKIPRFIDSYLEDKYNKADPAVRWKDPIDEPIIVADRVDSTKPLPVIGWTCAGCTVVNKAIKESCDLCGDSCPNDYEIPHNYIFTDEDIKFLKQLEDKKIEDQKREEQEKKELEAERLEYRKRLELLYKNKVAFTTEKSECPICMMDYEPGKSVILHSCLHAVCIECLTEYLKAATDPKVNCPTENCVGIINDGEISGMLTEEEYAKYEQLSLRTAEGVTDKTFHCTTPNCTAWVVYDDDVNFFDCPMCTKKNCLLCKAIHDNQTCQEYQDEMVIKARNDEAAKKDLEFLENMIKTGEAMKCPQCKILIQKKEGCDWMRCNMCKTELCWATKGLRRGPDGCHCGENGKRCSPLCRYCH